MAMTRVQKTALWQCSNRPMVTRCIAIDFAICRICGEHRDLVSSRQLLKNPFCR